MPHPRELPIPRPIANELKAVELARIWAVSGGGQHVTLSTAIMPDPAAWGILLVNLAKHVANAYQQTKGIDSNQTLTRLKAAFDAEWTSPTDKPVGAVIQNPQSENPK
ncbi:MAG TPA: DUF5076 domain-containing protein [Tepidisphaeraceae bacterium]|jgi:hypothetical protein|nr:DUF5076 domain-containing protein [Tepidisphaeraceae bacterium]HEV8605207.1 DUF5076 domain-containing protein [Tepidisphaeraceae bacterium]